MQRPARFDSRAMAAPPVWMMGAVLLTAGLVSADRAIAHMAWLKTICGAAQHPHCGWCFAAVMLVAAGLAVLGLAASPRPLASPAAISKE